MPSANEKFQLIHELINDPLNTFTVDSLCRSLQVSRSGYYRWCSAQEARDAREERDLEDFKLILEAYKAHGHQKGARSIQMALLHFDPPVQMNLKKIRRLMKKYNLFCPIRKANPYRRMAKALKTSNVAENLVRREFEAYGPRSVLLTDISYVPYKNGMAYLSTIIDAYTKQILAHQVSRSLEVDFVLTTVTELLEKHGSTLKTDTILHSDQGCHYTSHRFVDLLRSKSLRQSMSRKGNCWDNAVQESFFGHMKDHIKSKVAKMETFEEAKTELDSYIRYYNEDRCQWKLAKLSPNEFYQYITTGVYPLLNVEPAPIRMTQLALPGPSEDSSAETCTPSGGTFGGTSLRSWTAAHLAQEGHEHPPTTSLAGQCRIDGRALARAADA